MHTLNIPSSRLRSDPIARKWSNTMLTTQRRRLRAGPLRVGQSPFHQILNATAEFYRAVAYTDCYKLQRPHTAPKIVTVGLPVGPSAHETLPTRKRLFSPLYVSESVSRCLFVVECCASSIFWLYSSHICHVPDGRKPARHSPESVRHLCICTSSTASHPTPVVLIYASVSSISQRKMMTPCGKISPDVVLITLVSVVPGSIVATSLPDGSVKFPLQHCR